MTSSFREQFAAEARSERPDLALLCLLLAAEADPEVDERVIDWAQIELDRLAGMLPYGLRGRGGKAWASAVTELLGGRLGFHGTPADYDRLSSSLLHEVLRRRRGLPILLSVVWLEVARRAGAPVYGLGLPGHFVVGFGDPEEGVVVDPFAGGASLGAGPAELAAGPREPARTLDIVLRILNNIRAWASARPEHSGVALWAVELSLLLPSHPALLRYERARLLVERGSFQEGAAELDAYAAVVDAVDSATATRIRAEATSARALLN
ncbi:MULTISPECIES: transglutaminase-like domain-containing protein [unclassified Streptomyces]|uniref:transglutaminase family protein n=1 Tax=unclassified Streptomyces TaxID=2593676 RepID=UPI001BE850A9|nr:MULTISPECIES: transglutaminase-like domain-containing protein [unclassified Streptomyces]MBT2403011.1 transglutaminase family protein [Streptomyces sp. ISL-21]MBT2455371.1 transglutaminase family protein [Streptomyces sp. ISL-86]MBT2609664.1 transglutaminase family protein [Streptomyces sp. ISL-87]